MGSQSFPPSGSANPDPRNNGSGNGPLRAIAEIITYDGGYGSRDRVRFECGHLGTAVAGARRGRCRECKVSESAAGNSPAES